MGTPPLAYAGAAGVRQHCAVDVLQGLHLPVSFDSCPHLLGARGNEEWDSGLDAVLFRLLSNVGGSAHVFVRGVGTRADEGRRYRVNEVAILLHLLGQTGDGAGAVWRVGAYEVGLQLRQVDLHHAVVVAAGVGLALGIGPEYVYVSLCQRDQIATMCGPQVAGHALVVREDGGSRTEFGSHVGDSRLARSANGAGARPEILNDGISATRDGEFARQVEDDILGGGPTAHFAG